MDAYEATRIVFTRIQCLDPESASKIMGLLLIQEHGEKEMFRLAFGPETLVHSTVLKAKKELDLLGSPTSTARSSPPYFSRQNSCLHYSSSPVSSSASSTSPSSSSSSSSAPASAAPSSWASAVHHHHHQTNFFMPNVADDAQHHDKTVSGAALANSFNIGAGLDHPCASPSLHRQDSSTGRNGFYGRADMMDNFQLIENQLSFLNDHTLSPSSSTAAAPSSSSPSLPLPTASASANPNPSSFCVNPRDDYGASDLYSDILHCKSNSNDERVLFPYPSWAAANSTNNVGAAPPGMDHHHRGSCSFSDLCLSPVSEMGSSFPWKPCMYYARGYCKNGSNCRFLHGFLDNGLAGCVNLTASGRNRAEMRMVDAASAMVGGGRKLSEQASEQCGSDLSRSKTQRSASLSQQFVPPIVTYGKCGTTHPFSIDSYHLPADNLRSSRMEWNDFGNPGSRQIYLTFPADSTFREEDVSNYFSIYGPVQDVRIPYQQKRMFGFVTFVYPETVKIILAKGNPHYVCDARVLVKPYKEKSKIAEKKHAERGELSGCPSPTSLDSRDAYELQQGIGRFFYNSHEAFRRGLEEQADLQQAIELESKRPMGLTLDDVKKRSLSGRSSRINQCNHLFSSSSSNIAPPEVTSDYCPPISPAAAPASEVQQAARSCQQLPSVACTDEEPATCNEENNLQERSLEHNLPDSPFASPSKQAAASANSMFSLDRLPFNGFSNNLSSSPLLPATSTLDVSFIRSCYFQMPIWFSSDREAIGM